MSHSSKTSHRRLKKLALLDVPSDETMQVQFLHLIALLTDELLMLIFWHSSRSKVLSIEKLLEAIALDSASKITALGVRPNESEDLSISKKIWVVVTLWWMLGKIFL